MFCFLLTCEVAGVIECCVQTLAEDAELGDVERGKVKLGYIFEEGSVLKLATDVGKTGFRIWAAGQ